MPIRPVSSERAGLQAGFRAGMRLTAANPPDMSLDLLPRSRQFSPFLGRSQVDGDADGTLPNSMYSPVDHRMDIRATAATLTPFRMIKRVD
jgi:hypothetical protein